MSTETDALQPPIISHIEKPNEILVDHSTLPSSQAAYQDLFLRSIDGILLLDIATGKILEANDAATRILHAPHARLHGSIFLDYCRQDEQAELKKLLRIASRRYHPKTFEKRLIVEEEEKKPTEIVAEIAASPLKLHDRNEVLQVLVRDITEKKEAERKIAEYIGKVEEANKKLEELATTDGMTGLTNFRQFSNLLEMEHARASRYKSHYSILFCDLDHFKKYNDHNGHPAGDALLKHFAKILRACTRTTDFPARYGGEEFVVLLPETKIEQAKVVAERIKKTITSIKYAGGAKQPLGFVSCSIGVSGFPQDGETSKEVLKAADDVLYNSKKTGRNAVTLSLGKGKNPPVEKGEH